MFDLKLLIQNVYMSFLLLKVYNADFHFAIVLLVAMRSPVSSGFVCVCARTRIVLFGFSLLLLLLILFCLLISLYLLTLVCLLTYGFQLLPYRRQFLHPIKDYLLIPGLYLFQKHIFV